MSVPGIRYVVHNKARVALERAFRNPRKRVLGVDRESAEQKSALAGVVTIDKEVMHGTPCFAHTRVPVQTLIDFLETGETIDDFLAPDPSILRQHVFSFL